MKTHMEKTLLSIAISISLIFGSIASVPMYASAASGVTEIANVVVFVDFANSSHTNHTSNFGQCFMKSGQYTRDLFDGDASHPLALKQYLHHISYGQLQVKNAFPQISGDQVTSFRLANPSDYYVNTGNGNNGDQKLIQELISKNAISLPQNMELDYDKDGAIDNLTIVVASGSQAEGEKFYGHKSVYSGSGSIGGYAVKHYNIIPEYSVYMRRAVGIACHEFLHTIGYPDLYREGNNGTPVGEWDIMASAGAYLPYPLAYLRSEYTKWFSIPTVFESKQNYSLYAASKTTTQTKDQQAVILRTNYSDTEFFVLEYRKAGDINKNEYENILQASGLIIYRVNTRYVRNYMSEKDMIYVFRPGDSYGSNGREKGLNYVSTGALATELGRTTYGSSDPKDSLAEGAITYSDGTNSGIVISNVGSNSGDQITFDINFTVNDEYWTHVTMLENDPTYEMSSYMDTDDTIYSLQRKGMGVSASVYLYQYQESGWKKLGAPLQNVSYGYGLGKYNGNFYAGYVDSSSYAYKLFRFDGSGWTEVFASTDTCESGTYDMTSSEDGIYLSYLNDEGELCVYRYTTSGITKLGGTVAVNAGVANISLSAEHGTVVLAYRDANNNNQLYVKRYNSNDSSWKDVGDLPVKGECILRLHKNQIYLLRNGSYGEGIGELYRYSLTSSEGTWSKIGGSAFAPENVSERDICFPGDVPYIVMKSAVDKKVQVMNLADGQWGMLGGKITTEDVEGLQIFAKGEDLWVTYYDTSSHKVYIKSHKAKEIVITPDETPVPPGGDNGNTGGGDSGNTGGDNGNTGGDNNTGGDSGNTGGDNNINGGNTGNTGGNGNTSNGNTGNTGGNESTDNGNIGNTGENGSTNGGSPGNSTATPESPELPPAPVNTSGIYNLTVTMIKSNTLRLNWDAVPGVKSYEVYYSTSPDSGFRRLAAAKKNFYDFKKAKCGQTYYFQMRTFKKVGKQKIYGDFCPSVSGRTVLNGTVNAYISKATYNSITIKWNRIKDAKRYEIYYATSPGGEYHFLKSQGGNSFTHKGVQTGGTYYYQVRPVKDFYTGEFSREVYAKADLGALTKLKVVPSGEGRLKVSWKKVKGVKEYVILRSDNPDGPFERIAVTGKTSYQDLGLMSSTNYYYKVYGVSGPFKTNTEGPVRQMTKAARVSVKN